MNSAIYVYADESCLGNGKRGANPGGAGGLAARWKDGAWVRRDFWISEPDTTNNRMAIRSGIEALRLLSKASDVVFTSDSQYLVKGMSEWVAGWIRRGWMRRAGPVENADLWKRLVAEAERHRIEWRWVRGHAGHPYNEYANHLAIRAARTQSQSDGLVESGFDAWLETERGRGKLLDFYEFTPPAAR